MLVIDASILMPFSKGISTWERKKQYKLQIHVFVPVGLNECNDIRKMLNKKYLGNVPSTTVQGWKLKGSYST